MDVFAQLRRRGSLTPNCTIQEALVRRSGHYRAQERSHQKDDHQNVRLIDMGVGIITMFDA